LGMIGFVPRLITWYALCEQSPHRKTVALAL
jgi:hypothetical protein